MNDYSEHIAIIGGGIAGLSLGCFLLRKDIQPIIFERSSPVSYTHLRAHETR